MNRYNCVIFSAAFALLTFTSLAYISCTKDKCANYTCNNNGVCADGKCICTSQFTGVHCDDLATTYLVFKNHAKTTLTLSLSTFNDSVKTVAPGATVTFSVSSSQSLNVYVTTGNFYFNGALAGRDIGWYMPINTPISGSQTIDIDVPTDYYYLQVVNSSSYNITTLQELSTNYNITIPNDGKTYGIGYYYGVLNNLIQLQSPSKNWVFSNVSLPDTLNQVITLTAN